MLRSLHARLPRPRVLALAVTVALGACGGGSDDPAPSSPGTDPMTPDPVTGGPTSPDPMSPDPVMPGGSGTGDLPVAVDGTGLDAFADVDGGPLFGSMINSARLSGPVLGDGSIPNASLRAPLPVTVAGNETSLEVVGAWKLLDAVSANPNMRGTHVVLLVRNPTGAEICSVGARGALLDATGTAIPEADDVRGTALGNAIVVENPLTLEPLGGLDARFYFDSCIAPGDTTYIELPSSAPFDDVASLAVARLSVPSIDDELEQRRIGEGIRPLSYEIVPNPLQPGDPDFDPELLPEGPLRDQLASLAEPGFLVAVTMVNGSTDTLLSASWSGLVLDEAGLPLGVLRGASTELTGFEESVGIDPGEEVVLPTFTFAGYNFAGSASTLRVSLEWFVDEGIVDVAR